MSVVEEDVELRDLVAQTLEKNGCLAKLRAQLRASIFLALDEDIRLNTQQPLQNLRIQSYLQTPEGRTMFCLVREFLEFFNLQFTISVYEPESFLDSIGQYEGRQKVAKDLGLDNMEEPTVPLLQHLLKIAQSKSSVLDINLNLNENVNGSSKDASLNADSSYNKTESSSISKNSNNNSHQSQNESNRTESLPNGDLNTTFNISIPTVTVSSLQKMNSRHSDDAIDANRLHKTGKEERGDFENSQSMANKSGSISKQPINNVLILNEPSDTNNLSNEQNGNFNLIYDLNNSMVNDSQNNQNKSISNRSIAVGKNREDDTYEDTSSIPEDSEALEKHVSINVSEELENDVPFINPSNSNSESAVQITPKISNLTKSDSEKSKLSYQKPKANLSSLSDLPLLPSNKTRVSSDILPSLYSKEFKNKSNLKELDKIFDMDADYEEDFICNNELSLNSPSVNSNQSKSVTLDESCNANKTDLDMLNIINKKDSKNACKVISDAGKSVSKPIQTNCSNILKTGDQSNCSSITEYTSESVNSVQ